MKIKVNPYNLIVYLFFFSLNFETKNTLNLGIDFLITKFSIVILLLSSLINYKQFNNLRDYSKYLFPIGLFFFLLVIISYINRSSDYRNFFHVGFFLNVLILTFLINYSIYKPNILMKGLFVFALSMILVSLIYFVGPESRHVATGQNIIFRSTIFGGNANDIGLKLCISIFILISLIFENKLEFGNIRYLLFVFFPLLLKFMIDTGSRVAFIAFFLGLGIMFIVFIKRMEFAKKVNILILGSFILLMAIIVFLKNNTLIERLYDAFFKGDLSSRDQIWSNVIPIISKNLFFGVGETGLAQRMLGTSPHNVILEVMATTGIVGLIIFLIFIVRIVLKAFMKFRFKNELLPLVLFIPILGAILSGQIFEQKIYWVIFSYIISSSYLIIKDET